MAKESERLAAALATQVQSRRAMNTQLQALSEVAITQSYTEFDALVADKTRYAVEGVGGSELRLLHFLLLEKRRNCRTAYGLCTHATEQL